MACIIQSMDCTTYVYVRSTYTYIGFNFIDYYIKSNRLMFNIEQNAYIMNSLPIMTVLTYSCINIGIIKNNLQNF